MMARSGVDSYWFRNGKTGKANERTYIFCTSIIMIVFRL